MFVGTDLSTGKDIEATVVGRQALHSLDEQTTEKRGREEAMLRHTWISPAANGRLNQKVEPRPGALSTPTCP